MLRSQNRNLRKINEARNLHPRNYVFLFLPSFASFLNYIFVSKLIEGSVSCHISASFIQPPQPTSSIFEGSLENLQLPLCFDGTKRWSLGAGGGKESAAESRRRMPKRKCAGNKRKLNFFAFQRKFYNFFHFRHILSSSAFSFWPSRLCQKPGKSISLFLRFRKLNNCGRNAFIWEEEATSSCFLLLREIFPHHRSFVRKPMA